jgi:hypothetical protein
MTTITFACKDPNIVSYCEQAFGAKFQQAATHWNKERLDALQCMFDKELTREAKMQEWYDYEVLPNSGSLRRKVLRDENGPKLLVPTVTIDA